MNRRLILIIAIIVLIIAGVGVGLFLAAKSQKPATTTLTTPTLKKISDELMVSPVASYDGSGIWYFNTKSQLFRMNADGSGLTEYPLPVSSSNIKSVLWPRTGSDFLAFGTKLDATSQVVSTKTYYNSSAKTYTALTANIQSIDWMPDGHRVVYIWKSADNIHQQLVMANADGTGFLKIADVFWPDLEVKVSPDGKKALLYRLTGGDVNKIYMADLTSGQVTTLIDQGKNLEAMWLPDSEKFIYMQATATAYPKLFMFDLNTKLNTDLNLNTYLNKIVVDNDGKYLYASTSKPDNSGDNFIQMDLSTLKQTTYFAPLDNVRGSNLMLLGSRLYFISSMDGKLYTISK